MVCKVCHVTCVHFEWIFTFTLFSLLYSILFSILANELLLYYDCILIVIVVNNVSICYD